MRANTIISVLFLGLFVTAASAEDRSMEAEYRKTLQACGDLGTIAERISDCQRRNEGKLDHTQALGWDVVAVVEITQDVPAQDSSSPPLTKKEKGRKKRQEKKGIEEPMVVSGGKIVTERRIYFRDPKGTVWSPNLPKITPLFPGAMTTYYPYAEEACENYDAFGRYWGLPAYGQYANSEDIWQVLSLAHGTYRYWVEAAKMDFGQGPVGVDQIRFVSEDPETNDPDGDQCKVVVPERTPHPRGQQYAFVRCAFHDDGM